MACTKETDGVKTRLAAIAASIMLILTAGCTSPAGPESDPDHQTFASTAERPLDYSPVKTDLSHSTYARNCPVGEQDDGYGGCVQCTDYEGCFTESADMSYFFSQIVKWIRQYSADTYESMPDPDKWHFVTLGDSGFEGCTDAAGDRATYTDKSYEYCPLDRTVYVGERMMWAFYTRMGDAAPAVGIAHEWGHHLQNVAGLTSTTQFETINLENQADCIAGAWSRWLVSQEIMVEDDFGDIGSLLVAIGSIEGPGRDHGTVEEREKSFVYGLNGGLSACNQYAPDKPLIR
jgi:hypothetical protein